MAEITEGGRGEGGGERGGREEEGGRDTLSTVRQVKQGSTLLSHLVHHMACVPAVLREKKYCKKSK